MTDQREYETDVITTSAGELEITFLGHGSLLLTFDGKQIYVDPYHRVANYARLPKADVILVTHEHGDHLDPQAIAHVRTENTILIVNEASAKQIDGGIVMRNGDERTIAGIHVEAVPAYNVLHRRENGEPFHPRGAGNGYVLTMGDRRIYIAGDTENIPEIERIEGIDCAFLPMNLPYTMTPEMVADAARTLRPAILYPYHYGTTDTNRLIELLSGEEGIEVRIRRMA